MKVDKPLIGLILILYLFLRVFQLEERTPFRWDQVYNAWSAKNIIINKEYPLIGMQAKNTGLYIGPLYSYLNAGVFYITRLDPIAEPILATLISVFTFFVVWYVTKEIFSRSVAIVALVFYTVSFYIIYLDRVPWPVNLITPFSALIFYSLYKLLHGEYKFLLLLALSLGISFNAHFTAILYLPIILVVFLRMPKSKQMIKYSFISILIFFVFIMSIILFQIQTKSQSHSLSQFYNNNSHGFHATRFLQVAKDAFIEFSGIFDSLPIVKNFQFVFFPLFALIYLWQKKSKERLDVVILMSLWLLIPWIAFSMYKGEISNYYFTLTRPVVIMALSYLFVFVFSLKHWINKVALISFLAIFAFLNIKTFFMFSFPDNLLHYKNEMQRKVQNGQKVGFAEGAPESYLYYIYNQCDFCKK